MFPFGPICKVLSNSLWRLHIKSNFCWVVYEWKALKYCCCIALYQDCKWDFSFGARWAYTRPMRWSSSNFLWKAHSYTLQYKGPRVFWSLKSLKKWQRQWCRQGQFGQFLHVRLCLSSANWHHAYYVHKQTTRSSSLSAFSFDFFIFFTEAKLGFFMTFVLTRKLKKKKNF